MTVRKNQGSVFLYAFWVLTIAAMAGCGYHLYTIVKGMPIIPQKYLDYLIYGTVSSCDKEHCQLYEDLIGFVDSHSSRPTLY